MKEAKILGRNIKILRQSKGLTQRKLAKKVDLSVDTISKIERGEQENIGFKHLISIHQELDASLEELVMENANYIPIKIVVSDKNIKALKSILDEFMRLIAKKEK